MKCRPIVILGAGGQARETLDVIRAINDHHKTFEVLGFLDRDSSRVDAPLHGSHILGTDNWLEHAPPDVEIAFGIGSPTVRSDLDKRLRHLGRKASTLVHPSAVIARPVELGEGSIVMAGVVLTNSIHIGRHVILNVNVTISHDAVIEDFVSLSPGCNVTGNVKIHEGCDVGANATFIPGVSLGAWSIIGAGACVTKDIPERSLAVGVPAKVIRRL